jgi:hypothetical protein
VPPSTVGIRLILIVVLAVAAVGPHPLVSKARESHPMPTCWTLATIALVAGLFRFALVFLAYGALPTLPPTSAMLAGVAIASVALGLMTRWSLRLEWHDSSRLAVISGALLASMKSGFLVLLLAGAFAVDMLGKLASNLLACVVLVRLARRIRSRPEEPAASGIDLSNAGTKRQT